MNAEKSPKVEVGEPILPDPSDLPEPRRSILKQIREYTIEIDNRTSSADFANNPEACKRFADWFEASDLTKSPKTGKPSFDQLGEILHVSAPTAAKYVRNEKILSETSAWILQRTIGTEEYYDILHGKGAYDRDDVVAEKTLAISNISMLLKNLPLEKVKDQETMIAALVEDTVSNASDTEKSDDDPQDGLL